MKAVVLIEPGDVQLVSDFPEPKFEDDGVKIRVSYCGICGTDFHKLEGKAGSRPVRYPIPLGHEVSGIVENVGSKVTGFKIGDRVTVDPNWSCGKCWYCRNGKRHLCSSAKGVVKGMAEFICPPEENVYLIPSSLSLKSATLVEPLSCCLHGVDLLEVKQGQTVCIVGLGAIGQIMFQLLSKGLAGQIVVVETDEEKRIKALEMGATLFINPDKDDIAKALKSKGIECLEKVIDCGGVPATAETSLTIAGKGSTVVLFSVNDSEATIPFRLYDAFSKELVIKTSYINPGTTYRAITLLAEGLLDTVPLISKVLTLAELPEEMRTRQFSRVGKVVVSVCGE